MPIICESRYDQLLFAHLNESLKEHNMFFHPIREQQDVPSAVWLQQWAARGKYGCTEQYVLGLEVVLPDIALSLPAHEI